MKDTIFTPGTSITHNATDSTQQRFIINNWLQMTSIPFSAWFLPQPDSLLSAHALGSRRHEGDISAVSRASGRFRPRHEPMRHNHQVSPFSLSSQAPPFIFHLSGSRPGKKAVGCRTPHPATVKPPLLTAGGPGLRSSRLTAGTVGTAAPTTPERADAVEEHGRASAVLPERAPPLVRRDERRQRRPEDDRRPGERAPGVGRDGRRAERDRRRVVKVPLPPRKRPTHPGSHAAEPDGARAHRDGHASEAVVVLRQRVGHGGRVGGLDYGAPAPEEPLEAAAVVVAAGVADHDSQAPAVLLADEDSYRGGLGRAEIPCAALALEGHRPY